MTGPLNLKRALVFFDLETTGLDFKYDRIIEIGALKLHVDGRQERLLKRVNPGIRIPAEVTLITGIRNEDVATEPTFAQIAFEIDVFFKDADVAGYSIARFDVKVMVEEFKRVGLDFRCEERAILDAQAIFHQKERRDLSAAYKFYCNQELKDAHTAAADTEATYKIFMAQLERYPELPRDAGGLHLFCKGDQDRFVDGEGKFFWRDGEAVFNFGKFKSQPLRMVAKEHPEYLEWVIAPERTFSQDVIDLCYKAMKGEFPKRKEAC